MTGLLVIGGVISWCVIAFHEEVYDTTQAAPQWLKQLLSTEVAYHIDTAETHVTTPVQHAAAVVTDRVGLFGQTRPSPQVAGEQRSPATAVSGTASPLQYSGGITEAELEERLQQFATELPLAKQQLTQDTLRTLLQTTGRILGALQDRSVGGDRFIRQVERIYEDTGERVRSVQSDSTFTNPTLTNSTLEGTTTASDELTLNATLVLAATSPTTTDNRLYNTAGTLFWDGEAISGSTTGSWIVDGADVYRASGNVGIGLSSPTVRLQVAGGDVQFNDLSDNPAFYFDESTGRTGLGTSTPTNLLTVAGTLGAATLCDEYGGNCASVTALTSGTSPWSQAGSDIYYTAGNIGIGTTTPAGDLTVEDTAFADIFIRSTASNSDAKMHLINDAGSWAITNEGDKNDAFSIIDNTAGLSRFSINSAGEISIGTTTNEALLTVQTYASRDIFSLLETNGEEVFVVRENGNVGIGTTSPDYPLDVDGQIRLNGVASNFDLLFASNGQNEWSINGDGARIAISEAGVGEHFRVQTGGNIGIGTTTPPSRLSIQTTGTTDILNLFETGGQEVFTVLENGNVGIGLGASSTLGRLTVGDDNLISPTLLSLVNYTDATANNSGGQINFSGRWEPGSTITTFASIIGAKESTAANDRGYLAFKTRNGSGSQLERLRIDSQGNVGIGTTTPGRLLTVAGSAEVGSSFYIDPGTGSGNATLNLTGRNAGVDSTAEIWANFEGGLNFQPNAEGYYFRNPSNINLVNVRIDDSGDVGIGTSTALTARLSIRSTTTEDILNLFETGGQEVFTVLENGNVGIGTTSPQSKLDIAQSADSQGLTLRGFDDRAEDTLSFYIDGGNSTIINAQRAGASSTYLNLISDDYIQLSPDLFTYTQSPFVAYDGTRVAFGDQQDGYIRYNATDDHLEIFDAGAGQGLVVDNNGNIGIGTTTPAATLTVNESAIQNPFRVYSNTYNASALFASSDDIAHITVADDDTTGYFGVQNGFTTLGGFVSLNDLNLNINNSNGNIGIGTNSPDRRLHVLNSSSDIVAYFESGTGQDSFVGFPNSVATADEVRIGSDGSNLILGTNFIERLRIDATGNVAIGTTTANSRLSIQTSGTDDILNLFETSGDEVFTVLENGNVGIGTTTPQQLLTVDGGIRDVPLRVVSSDTSVGIDLVDPNGVANIRQSGLSLNFSTVNRPDAVSFREDRVGIGDQTPDAGLEIVAPTIAGSLFMLSSTRDADGDLLTVYQNSGSFNFGTSTDLNTRLSIQSTSTNDILNLFETDGQEVFTVLENGNVGIGTSTPSELLQLVGGDIRIDDSLPSIILDSTGGDSGTLSYTGASVWNLNNTNAGTDIIRFQSDGTDRVTIDFAGNVGIGTTSPASRLDVWGGLQVGTSSTPLLFADTSTNRIGINNSAPAWGIDAVAESKVGPDADNYILITDSEYKGANFSIDPNVVSNSVGTLIKARKDYNSGGDDDYAALFRDVTVNSNGSFNEQVYGERTEFEFNNNSGTFGDVYYSAEEFVINGANNANAPNIYGQTKLFSWDEVNMGTAYGHINQLFVTNSNATTLFNNNTPMVLTNTDANVVLADSASLSVNGTSEISTLYGMRSNVAFNDTASTSNALGTISQLSTTGNSNVDQAYGSYSALSAVGTSTISQAYGLFSVITELQDGTINEAYGLYLQDINIAGSEQFGIYQEGENDRNYFGGLSAMGTTTSAARLTIQATGTDDILNLFETDGEEVFTVLENGNVGVGTTSPSTRFQVEGLVGVNRNSGGFVFLNSAGLERAGIVSNAGNELILNTNGAVEAMRINVNGNVGIGTTSANILDQANAKVLTIQSGTSGSGSRMPAILELVGSGNVISGNNTAEIVFTHGNNQNNPTKITAIREGGSFNQNSLGFEVNGSEAMRIYSDNGNLLIGTSTATDAGRLTIQSTDTSDILNLFETGGQEVFTVIENGNVGIGTSTPSEALSLAGDGYISGSLTFGNSGNVIYDNASNLRLDTANRLLFNGNLAGVRDSYLTVGGTGILAFNDAAITTGSIDAGLSRLGSGIIAVGDGSVANASGTLIAGNIGIGTTTPTHTLTVAGTVGPESDDSFNLGAVGSDWGCLYYNSGTLGTCASDERLKTDIETLTFTSGSTTALQKLAELEMRTFAFTAAPDSQYAGLIAQEVLEVAPELVEEGSDGFLRVRYGNIQWLVLEALQELRTLVLGNREDIDALQAENHELRERLEQIEEELDIETAAPSTPDTTDTISSSETDSDSASDTDSQTEAATETDDTTVPADTSTESESAEGSVETDAGESADDTEAGTETNEEDVDEAIATEATSDETVVDSEAATTDTSTTEETSEHNNEAIESTDDTPASETDSEVETEPTSTPEASTSTTEPDPAPEAPTSSTE